MRVKRKSHKCKIRFEYLLWTIVGLTGVLIIAVNFVLLQQPESNEVGHNVQRFSSESLLNKGPVIDILRSANIDITPELRAQIPSWKEVVERFGNTPKIIGMDTCAAYREKVPRNERIIAPAGTFNSGTNMLFSVLDKNCHVRRTGSRRGVQYQPNWGKHQPPRFRLKNVLNKNINNEFILPIVVVRDPWTWMQSMCKTRYSAHWFHVVPDHCPNFIPNHVESEWFHKTKASVQRHFNKDVWKVDNVLDKANFTLDSKVVPVRVRYKSTVEFHKSLAHMWLDWYKEYSYATFPRLMIRLEDVVFRPGEVLKQVCDCVDGKLALNLTMKGDPAKSDDRVHGKNNTNLVNAMRSHIYSNRTRRMTADDVQFAKQVLKDSIVGEFGYLSPP